MAKLGSISDTATKPFDVMGSPIPGARIGRHYGLNYNNRGFPEWEYIGDLPDDLIKIPSDWALTVQGLNWISNFETVYLNPITIGNNTIIGYNRIVSEFEKESGLIDINGVNIKYNNGVSYSQAIDLLNYDLASCEIYIRRTIKEPITENMYIALVSFIRNNSIETFKKSGIIEAINTGYLSKLPNIFYNYIGALVDGQPVNSIGLSNRRRQEILLLSSDPYII